MADVHSFYVLYIPFAGRLRCDIHPGSQTSLMFGKK